MIKPDGEAMSITVMDDVMFAVVVVHERINDGEVNQVVVIPVNVVRVLLPDLVAVGFVVEWYRLPPKEHPNNSHNYITSGHLKANRV